MPGIHDPTIALEGHFITTAAPVQAVGIVRGLEWYFRARGRLWEFSVSRDPSKSPDEICSSAQGFYRSEQYGRGEFDASYVPLEEAAAIIRRCAKEFVETPADPQNTSN